jgi:hypothetical protein
MVSIAALDRATLRLLPSSLPGVTKVPVGSPGICGCATASPTRAPVS